MLDDLDSMAICAIRYTLGRQSYIVSDGQRWARHHGARSAHVRRVVVRDILAAIEMQERAPSVMALGSEHDAAGWRAVLADLQAMEAGDAP